MRYKIISSWKKIVTYSTKLSGEPLFPRIVLQYSLRGLAVSFSGASYLDPPFSRRTSCAQCQFNQSESRYDAAMESSLEVVWKIIPAHLTRIAEQSEGGLAKLSRWGFLYTMAASISLATAAGASIKFLGFPGDLPDVIHCVHKLGYVPMCQTLPMVSAEI